jgi:NADH-quinone oxidoreductase subunit L
VALFLGLFAPLVFFAPFIGFLFLAAVGLTRFRRNEWVVMRIVSISLIVSLLVAITSIVPLVMMADGRPVHLVHLRLLPGIHNEFEFGLFVDKLNTPFVILTALLSGLVAVFSRPYLHRDISHYRFFLLLLLFVVGMQSLFMASSFKALFVGWELVGLTSALLISFHYTRRESVEGALRAFLLYRFGDTALLLAAVILATHFQTSSFVGVSAVTGILGVPFPSDDPLAGTVLGLVLLGCAIKSAQFPFSSWLPRAMEGPTPSSAIFYGGLAVHAGFFLLLRLSTEFQMPVWFRLIVAVVGALSAVYGGLVGRMQCDIKGALAFASLAQVGVMFIVVAAGLWPLAILHFVGHASFRTCQILSAGSLIHESRPRRHPERTETRGDWVPPLIRSTAFDLGAGYRGALTPILRMMEWSGAFLAEFENRIFWKIAGGRPSTGENPEVVRVSVEGR